MARQRNPKRDEAFEIWIKSNKTKLLKDIADELDVSSSTLRKWKSQDNWDDKTKGSAPIEKERSYLLKGNTNSKGNKGNKSAAAPKGNQNAVTHGLFAKYLPQETKDIIEDLNESNPSDIIWNNIMIQYTAIIRAQSIMFVEDKDDMSKEKISSSSGPEGSSKSFTVQFAWDKHAAFLNSQSRAMTTLSGLIRQFIAIADERDERRKKLELMDAQIDKLKASMNTTTGTEERLNELLDKIGVDLDDFD